jgi:hypothetical protein
MDMSLRSLLAPILDDDHVTRGLEDAEARMLIEWLVERAEILYAKELSDECIQARVQRLCRRARAIARFVVLWCHERSAAAALQLAATERFGWPLPMEAMDPCDLLNRILGWEDAPEIDKELPIDN